MRFQRRSSQRLAEEVKFPLDKLHLLISPGFTIDTEYHKNQGLDDPRILKRWPEIRSEQLP